MSLYQSCFSILAYIQINAKAEYLCWSLVMDGWIAGWMNEILLATVLFRSSTKKTGLLSNDTKDETCFQRLPKLRIEPRVQWDQRLAGTIIPTYLGVNTEKYKSKGDLSLWKALLTIDLLGDVKGVTYRKFHRSQKALSVYCVMYPQCLMTICHFVLSLALSSISCPINQNIFHFLML